MHSLTIRVQVPTKRSGHSFTVVESTGYLFGGVPQARPPGPTNEMFKLDMSNRKHGVAKGCTEMLSRLYVVRGPWDVVALKFGERFGEAREQIAEHCDVPLRIFSLYTHYP